MRASRRLALAVGLVFLATAWSTGAGGQSLFQFEPLLLTGTTAPGLEPALVDEIGVYVDAFNPDPLAGGPQIALGGGVGMGAQVGGDGRPATGDGSGNAVWHAAGDVLTLAAAAGNPAPGTRLLFSNTFIPFDHDDGVRSSAR